MGEQAIDPLHGTHWPPAGTSQTAEDHRPMTESELAGLRGLAARESGGFAVGKLTVVYEGEQN